MDSNLSLSFELICLMEWLLQNGDKEIINLIKFSLNNGFTKELENMDAEKYTQIAEDLPNIILDFLLSLEDALLDSLEGLNLNLDKESKEKLIPAVEHLDSNKIDPQTIWLSMQQTRNSLSKNNREKTDIKQILFKKLLNNWSPTKDEPLN